MIKIGAQLLFLGHALLESQLSSFDFSIMSGTQVNGGNGDGGAPNPEEQCKKDEHYYFELVVFKVWCIFYRAGPLTLWTFGNAQVEDTLFRVPKSVFNVKDSAIGDMFLLPNVPNIAGLMQGSTDEFPIVFEDKSLVQLGVDPIKKADFQALLRVMLPLWGHFLVFGVSSCNDN